MRAMKGVMPMPAPTQICALAPSSNVKQPYGPSSVARCPGRSHSCRRLV